MRPLLLHWLSNAVALWVAAQFVPGLGFTGGLVQLLLVDRSSGNYFITGFGIPIELVVAVSAVVTLALYARALPDATAAA